MCYLWWLGAGVSGALEEAATLLSALQGRVAGYFASLRVTIDSQRAAEAATIADARQELVDTR